MATTFKTNLLASPYLWLTILFIIGLPTLGIDLFDDHAWRQSITVAVSRNLLAVDFNPFFPRYNICGAQSPDILGTEFPLLNILIASGYKLFGEHITVSRFINWTVSIIGINYYYKTITLLWNKKIAFISMLLLMGSLFTVFARKVMPDTFSLSLVFIAMFYYAKYLNRGNLAHLVVGFIFFLLGTLSKIPAIVFLVILFGQFIDAKIDIKRKFWFSSSVVAALIIIFAWYFIWVPHLNEITTCSRLIYSSSITEGWKIVTQNLDMVAYRFFKSAFHIPVQGILFFTGLFYLLFKRAHIELAICGFYTLAFSLFVLKSGDIFHTHTYYILPFIPLMCFVVANMLSHLKDWISKAIAIVLFIFSISYFHKDVYLNHNPHFGKLKELCKQIPIHQHELIMINNGVLDPSLHYFANLSGWTVNNDIILKYTWMPDYIRDGLKYIIIDKTKYDLDSIEHKLLLEDQHFAIYKPRTAQELKQVNQ
jgi:4-amino-4-deoxy-L-arabinose transferase-like glycosyltransferase